MLWIIARHRLDHPQMVEVQPGSQSPGHKVIGARGVAADANRANLIAALSVECKTAAKNVYAADAVADQRVPRRSERPRIPLIGNFRIDRIAVLQPVEIPPGCTAEYKFAVDKAKPVGAKLVPGGAPLLRLKSLAVLAFCAEMMRLPSH